MTSTPRESAPQPSGDKSLLHSRDSVASARPQSVKILFLGRDLVGGGVEGFLRTILGVVTEAGYEPVLALFRETGLPADCAVYRRYDLGKKRAWDNFAVIARLARVIDREQPAILFSVDSPLFWRAGEALSFARCKPVSIVRVANNPYFAETGWRQIWANRAYRKAQVFVANSRGLAEGFQSRYPRLQGRVRVCYNPIDIARIRDLARQPRAGQAASGFGFVAVGRLDRQKRYDLMIDAFAEATRHADVTLDICGEGPQRTVIESRIAAHGLTERIRLLGHQENPYPRIAGTDGVLLTSDYEGLPNALVEAQCLGRPVIATNCPYGVDEVVADGETGFLEKTGDVAGIAAAIVRLATNRGLAARLGREGQVRAEARFALDSASKVYIELLRDALDHGKASFSG